VSIILEYVLNYFFFMKKVYSPPASVEDINSLPIRLIRPVHVGNHVPG